MARIVLARLGPILAAQGLPLRDVEVTENAVHLRHRQPGRGGRPSASGAPVKSACVLLRETVADGIEVTVEEAV